MGSMTSNQKTFWASDLHLGHKNIVKFKRKGTETQLRTYDSIEDHDRDMKERWNAVVGPDDIVNFLGDWAMNKRYAPMVKEFNGKIIITPGNHDPEDFSFYMECGFYKVRAHIEKHFQNGDSYIASHIPYEAGSASRWKYNIHGHTHADVVNHPRYHCVSMEQIGFAPITTEELYSRIQENERAFADTGTAIDFSERYLP